MPVNQADAVLAATDWSEMRLFVGSLPPSWRLAAIRVWSSSLLTSTRTGQGMKECMFCRTVGGDRFPHLVQCGVVRNLVGDCFRSFRGEVGGWSVARFLGLRARDSLGIAPIVLFAFLHQKVRHNNDLEQVRRCALELLLRPLARSSPVWRAVRGRAAAGV